MKDSTEYNHRPIINNIKGNKTYNIIYFMFHNLPPLFFVFSFIYKTSVFVFFVSPLALHYTLCTIKPIRFMSKFTDSPRFDSQAKTRRNPRKKSILLGGVSILDRHQLAGGSRDMLTSVKRSVRIIYEHGRMVLIAGNGVKRTVYG